MDDKITIIEGPTPAFEHAVDGWVLGLNDGPEYYDMTLTRLRTGNAHALVERCHRTWNTQSTMYLHFRDRLGMEEKLPIVAIRPVESRDGQMVLVWCRKPVDEIESEVDSSDDEEDNR